MSVERRLHEHLHDVARELPEPSDRLGQVQRRGRRRRTAQAVAVALTVTVVLTAVPAVVDSLRGTRIDLAPANPVPAPIESEEPPPSDPPSTDAADRMEVLGVDQLGAAVLEYRPGERRLGVWGRDGDGVMWEGRVDAAIGDGRGGVVVQSRRTLVWLPDAGARQPRQLVDVEDDLRLRVMLADGRVLYSVTERNRSEDMLERFYAITLAEDGATEQLAQTSAFESWREGPVRVRDGSFVHAACHLLCTLYRGIAEAPAGAQPLYHGGGSGGPTTAIDGLTAAADGRVIAFVESHPGMEPTEEHPPVLVVLDGATFAVSGRVELPVDPELAGGATGMTAPTVSMSSDGERLIVSLGSGVRYLVEGVNGDAARVRRIVGEGVLRWLDPVAADAGG